MLVPCAWAIMSPRPNVPIPADRLIRNAEAMLRENPNDPNGHYTMARALYMRFAAAELNNAREKARADLRSALTSLGKAVEMAPANPLYHLTLASIRRDAARFAQTNRLQLDLQIAAGVGTAEKTVERDWKEAAIREYRRAYELSISDDLKKSPPLRGELISVEASGFYLQLVKQRGIRPEERSFVQRVEQERPILVKKPRPITPIVLTLEPTGSLREMLRPEARVAFDLDGTGLRQRYPWLHPRAAFLVWDPMRTGVIRSGLQLFGNVTWWMFWRDGYAAMDALDDDRNGWIDGAELAGLALWFDRNENGHSDPGEVRPVEECGIEALAVRATAMDEGSPTNPAGLRLTNGRVFPTWDWVTQSRLKTRLSGPNPRRLVSKLSSESAGLLMRMKKWKQTKAVGV